MKTMSDVRTHAKYSGQDTFLVKIGVTYYTLKAVDAWLDLWTFPKEPKMGVNVMSAEIEARYPEMQILGVS